MEDIIKLTNGPTNGPTQNNSAFIVQNKGQNLRTQPSNWQNFKGKGTFSEGNKKENFWCDYRKKKETYQRCVGSYMENRVLGNEEIALHHIKRIILVVSQTYLILKNASAGANSKFGSAQYQVQGLHLILKFLVSLQQHHQNFLSLLEHHEF